MQPLSYWERWKRRFYRMSLVGLITGLLVGGSAVHALETFAQEVEEAPDPSEIVNGERLFLETRFAQLFSVFLNSGGGVNDPLPEESRDKNLDFTIGASGEPPNQVPFAEGPFKGMTMNCRACHFVDEHVDRSMRTYTDFARRSPIQDRPDLQEFGKTTVRNSPPLVNASLPRKGGLLLHFDAEFKTMRALVKGTLTGPNFGWRAGERRQAIAHIARVIREDDGSGIIASDFGGLSYTDVLEGNLPPDSEFLLPKEFQVKEVAKASDRELFRAVAKLTAAYTEDLLFSQDEDGNFNLSPFDVFLEDNFLPRHPRKGETDLEYSRRLLEEIQRLEVTGRLTYVARNPNTEDGSFQFHEESFRFGPQELQGLKIFFTEPPRRKLRPSDLVLGGVGNCIACHAAPNFTDFRFHNTGTAQEEYNRVHGAADGGLSFADLKIPGLKKRNANPNRYLPATEQHPNAQEVFRSIPSRSNPQLTDLGLWNIFANPDFPKSQKRIFRILCSAEEAKGCRTKRLLRKSIALFKTPGLRDLGHSAPYMHTGRFNSLTDVIQFYQIASDLARAKELRNGARALRGISLVRNDDQGRDDITPLVLFLQSLNEDYE